ncbi:MAG TPA: VOC family protein [Acidimicrobiales bacterium]|nr:VOC family protein [Acidimicrobiales bacterium]
MTRPLFSVVDHVGITVADLDRSVGFWERLLDTPGRDRGLLAGPRLGGLLGYPAGLRIETCWVDLPGGGALELLHYLDREEGPLPDGTAHPGNVHICLRVGDMATAHGHAVACGARPVGEGPIEVAAGPNAGMRVAYLRDPDGVTVELRQLP